MKLYTKILIGVALGVLFGLFVGHFETTRPNMVAMVKATLEPVGQSFIRLISMIIVPLVFASLTLGIASLGGDLSKIGRLGIKTIAFFLITTMFAIAVGIGLAVLLEPGKGIDEQTKSKLQNANVQVVEKLEKEELTKTKPSLKKILLNIIPQNPIRSMVYGDMLQIIFFAMFLGIAVTMIPKKRQDLILDIFSAINAAMIMCVTIVMKFAPYGVFALISVVVLQFGYRVILLLLKYTLVVMAGQGILLLVIDVGAVYLFTRVDPLRFLRGIKDAMIMGFSTSSSSATLPVTMECCEKNLGISNEVTSFVTPLGATINMNGTALYQGVAAVFIAQVYGIDMDVTKAITVVVTATLASVGTAGVPGVGMITLAMVLRTIDVPLQGIALIIGVDRILDMVRSMVNMTGDCACALIVAHSEGELRLPIIAKPGMGSQRNSEE